MKVITLAEANLERRVALVFQDTQWIPLKASIAV